MSIHTLTLEPGNEPAVLFLDGQHYREHIGAAGVRAAWLHSGTGADRHRDLVASEAFARFVLREILPRTGPVAAVAGLSLSGLAAAHLAFRHPDHFPVAICQSPSAWVDDERLVREVRAAGGARARAWISVGHDETETGVRHPPTGLLQATSQLASCRRLADAWGPAAQFQPYDGGHDFACWRAELPAALRWALGRTPPTT